MAGHFRRPIARYGALIAAACLAAACTGNATPAASGGPTISPSVALPTGTGSHPAAAWPMYGQNAARTGVAAGLPPAGPLSVKWTATMDGAVYGQPLAVAGLVIAATENDTVYALDAGTGHVVWRRHVGTPVSRAALNGCGNIFPLGITGTPVYDQATGLVYAVAETTGYHHMLFGLAVRDGTVRVQREIGFPAALDDPAYVQQRPGLGLAGGYVVVEFGGLYGDCGQYTGSVVAVPADGTGPLASWHTPTRKNGAVWALAGSVSGPHGYLWVSTGNGAAGHGQAYDGSDSVTSLELAGGQLRRLDFFAPSVWAADNVYDMDLGSTQPALTGNGSTLIVGKRGIGYLLTTTALGGIGGQRAALPVCSAYGAAAVSGDTVYEPCTDSGLAAVAVDAATRSIRVVWRGPSGAHGSASVGGGAVWVTDSSGFLYELDPATGAVRHQVAIGATMPRFSSVSLAGREAFVGTLTGVVAVSGALPPPLFTYNCHSAVRFDSICRVSDDSDR